jgi:hypothetical protein
VHWRATGGECAVPRPQLKRARQPSRQQPQLKRPGSQAGNRRTNGQAAKSATAAQAVRYRSSSSRCQAEQPQLKQ